MPSGSDVKFAIAKLNNANYQLCTFKLEIILGRDGLWQLLNTNRPTDEETEDWDRKDRQAKVIINLLVEDDQLIRIRTEKMAKGMWTSLQKLHERSSLNSKLFLLRKLYKMRLEEGQQMCDHMKAMLEIIEQLRYIRQDINDNHIVALLLCSLPKTYNALINALETRPAEELMLDYVKVKLIDEYDRRKKKYVP